MKDAARAANASRAVFFRAASGDDTAMSEFVFVYSTFPDAETARRVAEALVAARLAACVNIAPPVRSIYRWEGKVADEKEYLLIIKSSRDLFTEIKAAISKIHSYHTPEIICLPIIDGSRNYLQWVGDSVKKPGSIEPA